MSKLSEGWTSVRPNHRRSLKASKQLVFNEVNFPFMENKYSALQQDGDRPCSESLVAQFDLLVGLPEQSSTLDTKNCNPVSLSR